MAKMLIVNDLLLGGGVEKLMLDLVWAWHDKYEITILTDHYEAAFNEVYPENVKYLWRWRPEKAIGNKYIRKIAQKLRRISDKCYEKSLCRKLDEEKFDIAIAIKEGWKMKEVASVKAKRKFAWVHTDYTSYNYTYGIFGSHEKELECMKQYDGIVCVAEKIKDSIIEIVGDPGNLLVKYNPIDVEAILKKSEETVVDLEKEADVPLFVTVGRLNYQKGFDLLLEACHMLEVDGFKFKVAVLGAEEPWGDEHNKLYRTQKRLGIDSVSFLGGRKNPYKYMKMADWFLSSSIFEGYSLVSQEAAVLDVPLILTDCSGVRELLGENEYGIIMEPSVLGIYTGMKSVLEDSGLHEKYKNKIMERKQIIQYKARIDAIEELWKMN